MRILFLDIDGVLVNARSLIERRAKEKQGEEACVEQLNRITDTTGAVIVVSSSWRFSGLNEMRLILNYWGVTGEVIDITPDLCRKNSDGIWVSQPRGLEILLWLHQYEEKGGRVDSFVILDDDADMDSIGHRHVQTKFEDGLTETDADKAIELLNTRI